MSVLEKEMSVNLSKEKCNQTLHRLSVTGFPTEISLLRMVVVGSREEWIG